MQYFDMVALKDTAGLEALGRRLGYRKIFLVGRDFALAGRLKDLNPNRKALVRGKDEEVLLKAIKESSVVGVVFEDSRPSGKFLDSLNNYEKLLVIPVAPLMCPDQESRLRSLHKTRELLRSAMMSRAEVALATLAEDKACMASSAQMLEIARLIGAGDAAAKEMLGKAGRFL
jgi:RNase P/RNase MRP subunit p30